ncbi:MAG: polyphosphate polymerase domain-containing protein [Clostridiales bacterium]|jgi:hypothetical protein|nr:polyphosphate polymerase domain-containing protein [Clostridiales bacterium]
MAETFFKRREIKYIIDEKQREKIMELLDGYMKSDGYGEYTVRNIYYDTDAFDIARMSADKPLYKEKLRLRSYEKADGLSPVFLELKKKYDMVTYKRRVMLPHDPTVSFISGKQGHEAFPGICQKDLQVLGEIRHFLKLNPVAAKVFLCYDRIAMVGVDDCEFRVTLDSNVRFRRSDLRLGGGLHGTELLDCGKSLMEIKAIGAMPMRLSRLLSECGIFPSSFSKYGQSYRMLSCKGGNRIEGQAIESA